jgi:SDR family mycofactocin-dependent oxidoreductase
MSGVLEGRVALVTGGARGMGRSHALAMAREGADVVLVDLCHDHPAVAYPMATIDDLTLAREAVEAEGVRCASHVADVRDLDALERIVALTESEWGSVDIAVANAGVSHMAVINQETAEGWGTVIDINLTGTFNTFRAVSPGMMKRRWGRLVGVSSMMGRASNPTMAAYSASKWGVIGMVKAAAQDLAHHGVTVNAVAPGNIATDMVLNEHMFHFMRPDLEHPTAEDMAPVMAGLHAQPVPWLQPEEVTRAVMYLVDPGAEHITGTVMDVSAGASARFTA